MSKFRNIPNKPIRDEEGRIHWSSRSVAVVSIIILNDEKVLLTKRGPNVTSSNKWCNPCGYLDWNETATEAVHREIWEETGLDIENCNIVVNHIDNPYNIITDPNLNQFEDVVLYFGAKIQSDTEPFITKDNAEKGEVLEVKWVPLEELNKYEFAFNHSLRIRQFLNL